jgi:hypothetical protein
MLEDCDFKFKRRHLPRTIGSPAYPEAPKNFTPISGQFTNPANKILHNLTKINDTRSNPSNYGARSATHSDVSVGAGSNNYAMEITDLNANVQKNHSNYSGLRRKRLPREKNGFSGLTCLQHGS